MSRRHPKTLRQIWWAPPVCFGLAWALSLTTAVKEFEWHSLDLRTIYRTQHQRPPDPRLAVILFEDDTEARLGQPWPVDRQYHAQLTQVLALAGAKMVAWDVILDASREGQGDDIMGQVAEAAGQAGTKVISAAVTNGEPTGAEPGTEGPTKPLVNVEGDISKLDGDKYAFIPFPQLRAASAYGFADAPPGPDGMRRDVPLVVRLGKEVYPSLALQIVLGFYDVKPEQVRVQLGDAITFPVAGRIKRVPIDARGNLLVNYRYDQTGSNTDMPVFSYGAMLIGLSEVYLENKPASSPLPDMKGKIVIIGQTVTGKADAGPSPLRALTPLSFIQANAVNNILDDDLARAIPQWQVWVLALVLGFLGLAFIADRSVFVLCGSAVAGLAGFAAVALFAWVWWSWWVPWVAPSLGFVLLQFVVIGRRVWIEQKAKQEIKGMFGAYVSPQLVDRLVKAGEPPRLGGHIEHITAYFSDIQGFSSFSELLPPERLVELMNEYLTACTDIVQEERGTLDKYIGDAVVAMFGAPVAMPDHSHRACVAALRVQQRLGELREKWRAEGDRWPKIVQEMRTRIGLNTGRCVIGNMGSRTRFNYTMMGDDVNLAARMESGAKSWGAYTMCTEATKLACEEHGGDGVAFRPLGRIVVKGRAHAVPIYEIVGFRNSLTPETRSCIEIFSAGLERYYARDWDGALECFGRSAKLEPNVPGSSPGVVSNPSLVYIDIVAHYKVEPPGEQWTGVYVMKEK
ncbi:MAG TPA: adenylate/guanylate cyclase domain-containing protein [Lacunisphaera sp.]|nr:adenylate/guanylate cyclase domain-containing protein [Lacunisphaera sp.]